ncbi:Protein of unknown function [Leuconostoc citreum]|nr:Protein of unknown function [Leuconostoc citreum LBAE C10]CCF26402.1 Protein of unknown function [Leuconostoc citreum LBAE C11]CCF29264.1 Protein of unknown function [Leuconostoc citreum LBAE E16]CDX65179.1 Protein of unknown function [Leuconostoc citreum]CDX66951.1 Protein of unknown function [Leuconostoc citreum]
MTPRDE